MDFFFNLEERKKESGRRSLNNNNKMHVPGTSQHHKIQQRFKA